MLIAEPRDGDTIAVWFSCGAASAIALRETLRLYGHRCNVRAINNPIKEEDSDNRRFLADVESYVGMKIEIATNPKYPNCSITEVFDEHKYMSGVQGARCTLELKKKARQHWELNNHHNWLVMGFCADEKPRADNFRLTERSNLLTPLVDLGISHFSTLLQVRRAGILLPISYRKGFNNANCIGCVKATSPTYWNHVRRVYPEIFAERAIQSRRLGVRLVRYKGVRIFLDELPEDAIGRPMPKIPECGIFCEEPAQLVAQC